MPEESRNENTERWYRKTYLVYKGNDEVTQNDAILISTLTHLSLIVARERNWDWRALQHSRTNT